MAFIPLEERVATRIHVVTDMGNGGSYCSNCQKDLGQNPIREYTNCPSCNYKLVNEIAHAPIGGSDFK